jgi:stalled ribosome alternative rescue factor ArfA
MPNAATQLVVDPLFRRSVLFFFRGVREDVLRDLFSSKDFFRKQVKAERTERGKS